MDASALLHDVRRLMRGGVQQGRPAERHVVAAAALASSPTDQNHGQPSVSAVLIDSGACTELVT
jgi:hypothetical protein